MKNSKILRFALPIAAALAVAAGALAITASAAGVSLGLSPTAATTKAATPPVAGADSGGKADIATYCGAFMKNFAADLNVPQAAVDAAARKALGQTLDQAVVDGKVTADQAAKVKTAIPSGSFCAAAAAGLPGLGDGPHGQGPKGGGRGMGELGAYMTAYMDASAKAAGLNGAADLKVAPNAGQSLSAIAKAHNIDEPTFRKNLIANLTPTLDAAVRAGKLTGDQEKAILSKIQTGRIPFWNAQPAHRGTPPSGAPVPPAA